MVYRDFTAQIMTYCHETEIGNHFKYVTIGTNHKTPVINIIYHLRLHYNVMTHIHYVKPSSVIIKITTTCFGKHILFVLCALYREEEE